MTQVGAGALCFDWVGKVVRGGTMQRVLEQREQPRRVARRRQRITVPRPSLPASAKPPPSPCCGRKERPSASTPISTSSTVAHSTAPRCLGSTRSRWSRHRRCRPSPGGSSSRIRSAPGWQWTRRGYMKAADHGVSDTSVTFLDVAGTPVPLARCASVGPRGRGTGGRTNPGSWRENVRGGVLQPFAPAQASNP
jgi:hypothetical protein